ncbi:MAG: hypothetical protein LM564_01985 [Desulfurococcaceae archaeon]|nr:hypothetical protein [Desulfurococcaceae archaeon]
MAKSVRTSIVKRPGDTLKLRGVLFDRELGTPLKGLEIRLQQYDPTTGLWKDVMSTTTAEDGSYTFVVKLPEEEGSIRLRTYFPGTEAWKADASPPITVTIKKPKAAPTALSIMVE